LAENNLKTVTFSSTVERIEYNALAENKIEEIVISKNIVHLGEEALANNPITKITIEGKNNLEAFNYLGDNWNNGCNNIKFK
ncbi:MAG: leucine-rich repeat protein, partial [Bacilli bacterium]|nr:leucine-rich repeat protein [Bacilli bacterium]